MLFSPVGIVALQRIQGAYIDEAADRAADRVLAPPGRARAARGPARGGRGRAVEEGGEDDGFDPDEDPLLGDAIQLVVEMGTASTSMLQRRLRLGYTRAGRLIDMLERRGVISGYEGSKPRQVLVTEADLPRVLAALGERAPQPAARTPDAGVVDATTRRLSGSNACNRGAVDCAAPDNVRAHARDRRDAARGADARQDRHLRGRGGDQDPRQVPARARERGVGPAARARRSSRASCAPTPRRWASTRRRWSRSTAALRAAVASASCSRSRRAGGGRDAARRRPGASARRWWRSSACVL